MLKAAFQEDFFKNGQNGFLTSVILHFFCISCHRIDPCDHFRMVRSSHWERRHHQIEIRWPSVTKTVLHLYGGSLMPVYLTFKVRWGGCWWPGDGWDDARGGWQEEGGKGWRGGDWRLRDEVVSVMMVAQVEMLMEVIVVMKVVVVMEMVVS